MNKERRIYVVGHDLIYANWMQGVCVDRMDDADLVVFTGGEDVNPHLYNKKAHPTTSFNAGRDLAEVLEFTHACIHGKHIIGICRGSQFVCAASKGILVQNQHHPSSHPIDVWLPNGKQGQVHVTSTHHQRQFPFVLPSSDWKLLGWCNLSPYSEGESEKDDLRRWDNGYAPQEVDLPEVEECLYVKTKALGLQHHPEFVYPPTNRWQKDYISHCRDLLHRHLTDKL